MSEQHYLVVFTPSGKRGRFARATPVLQAARELGVDIDSVCGGRAICGRCQVEPSFGHFSKHGIQTSESDLSPAGESEQRYRHKQGLDSRRRLSCQARVLGNMVIDVPASSQVHHQVIRKKYEDHDIEINPVVHLYFIEASPAIADERVDAEQVLLDALRDQWQFEDLSIDNQVLAGLNEALSKEAGQATVAVRMNRDIVALWPGFRNKVYGVALDIGTTSLAAQLCDLTSGDLIAEHGRMNPQIRFGEDLMSRVSWCMLNEGGARQLTESIHEAVNELIDDLVLGAGLENEDILEMTVVGNPIMHHLFLGLDPQSLGVAPFTLVLEDACTICARELGIHIHAGARIYALPCIAGHVGADSAAILLAETPHEKEAISLIVDVGTNAEIILGNQERLLAASSPTGPAFEGAQISHGQRAAPGAIERVRIDPHTLEPRFRVVGNPCWSDEADFYSETHVNNVTGICGSGIIEAIAEMYLRGIIDEDGVIRGELADRTERIIANDRTWSYVLYRGTPEIRILQTDVRAIQLAKAALHAGARLLMDRLGIERVDRIRLAGAFGSFIDVKYAMILGLIPDCNLDEVSTAGNAAGTGARIALLNGESRKIIEQKVREIEKIETAMEESFQAWFVEAMAIPHKLDSYKNLRKAQVLPVSNQVTKKRRRRRGNKERLV